jgi:bacillithiol system protein YtxJ
MDMNKIVWNILKTEDDLQILKERSSTRPQVIYKHSSRCFVSSIVRSKLEKSTVPGEMDFHFLDLISYRPLSNKIAADFKVPHESPQVLVIRNNECIYDASHDNIDMEEMYPFAA